MASVSEKTFGSRLLNAQKLATHLSTFGTYVPATPDCSLVNYEGLITSIVTVNGLVATSRAAFSTKVDDRVQKFLKASDSMAKRLSPLFSYINALFGKGSVEAELVGGLIKKLRGVSTSKFKKDESGEWVSQSQRSYGSMTQNFSELIETLTSFGATYAPTNENIKIAKLTLLLTELNDTNEAVTLAYGVLKTHQDQRLIHYDDLTSRSLRIKNTVKSIYGTTSTEYQLIKGLKI